MARVNRENLTAAAYIACWKIVRYLPQPVAAWLFERGADYASDNGAGDGTATPEPQPCGGPRECHPDVGAGLYAILYALLA